MGDSVVFMKSYSFAVRIVNLYKLLSAERREFVLSKQCLRSGTAIGALVSESKYAQSRADFVNKMSIALKEANETLYWLMLLKDTDFITAKEYESIVGDADELIKMLSSIVKTTKQTTTK